MRLRPVFALAAVLWAAGAPAVHAADAGERAGGGQRIYRWIDENGIAHYTTDPARIPAPLRERIGNPEALSQKPLSASAPDSWADLDAEASAEDAEADGAAAGAPGLLGGSGEVQRGTAVEDGESSGAQPGGGAAEDGAAEAENGAAEAEDNAAETEALGGAGEGGALRNGETRGSELGSELNGGGALQSGRRGNARGLRMRAAVQRLRGANPGAHLTERAASLSAGNAITMRSAVSASSGVIAHNATAARGGASLAAGPQVRSSAEIAVDFAAGTRVGGVRLAGARMESAERQRLAKLDARIAKLEARIAADEERIKRRISAPEAAAANAAPATRDGDTTARNTETSPPGGDTAAPADSGAADSTATAAAITAAEDEALLALAARLPGQIAKLRALREERAALAGGG